MKKALGSWSGMRKYLEDEMLTPTLRGRVRYNCTRYVGMDNCHVFEVYLDGTLAKRFSWETVNDWLIENGRRKKGYGLQDYWSGFFDLLAAVPPESRTAYTDEEFCEALEIYRNQPIADSICAANPIVRMFALLDRRVGKRRLLTLQDALCKDPAWLTRFYALRIEAEKITVL